MPWSYPSDMPSFAKHKTEKEQKLAVKVANETLAKTGDDSSAIFAAIAAVKNLKKKTEKSVSVEKQERKLPSHIPTREMFNALKQEEQQEIVSKALVLPAFLRQHSLPEGVARNIRAMNFNKEGKLVVVFDTGEIITTDAVAIQEIIEQHIGVAISREGSGGETRQEVFIGAPPTLPTYPALIFVSRVVDGQTVYEMQVNVP